MKTSRRDQYAICALLFENDLGFDDSMGLDPSMGQEQGTEVVMEIDPVGPVSPVMGDDEDELYAEAKGDLKKLVEFSSRLQQICQPNSGLQPWMLAKISKAADYITDIVFQLDDQVDFANTGVDLVGPEQSL